MCVCMSRFMSGTLSGIQLIGYWCSLKIIHMDSSGRLPTKGFIKGGYIYIYIIIIFMKLISDNTFIYIYIYCFILFILHSSLFLHRFLHHSYPPASLHRLVFLHCPFYQTWPVCWVFHLYQVSMPF